jgi:hypothetical protein
MEGGSTHRYLCHGRKPKRWFETHTQVNEWQAKHVGLFATRVVRRPTHHEQRWILCISSINPPGAVGSRRKPPGAPTTLEGVSSLHLHNDGSSTSRRRDPTLCGQHKSDKEPLPLVLLYPIILTSRLPSHKLCGTGRLAYL